MNRVCEIEDSATVWYEPKYYPLPFRFDLTFLTKCFQIVELVYSESVVCKCHLIANKPGIVNICGVQVTVTDTEVLNEVKRIGYLRDRELPVSLRVDDALVVYIQQLKIRD